MESSREKEGASERANILVDRSGGIASVRVYDLKQLPDLNEVTDLLKTR